MRVSGNRIYFLTGDWYEVQSATSFNTLSEGRGGADLPHGEYVVINHTTGERTENVVVGSNRAESPDIQLRGDNPTIISYAGLAENASPTGYKLSFDNNDLYEVQSVSGLYTVSKSTGGVTIPVGDYNIINHTTGERIDNVRVRTASDSSADDSDADSSIFDSPIRNGGPTPTVVLELEDSPAEFVSDIAIQAGTGAGSVVVGAMIASTPVSVPAVIALGLLGGTAAILDGVNITFKSNMPDGPRTETYRPTYEQNLLGTNDIELNVTDNEIVYKNPETGDSLAYSINEDGKPTQVFRKLDPDNPDEMLVITVTAENADGSGSRKVSNHTELRVNNSTVVNLNTGVTTSSNENGKDGSTSVTVSTPLRITGGQTTTTNVTTTTFPDGSIKIDTTVTTPTGFFTTGAVEQAEQTSTQTHSTEKNSEVFEAPSLEIGPSGQISL